MALKYFGFSPLVLTILLLCGSCNKQPKETYAFFGGEIVNPKSDYVFLYHFDDVVDSVKLDEMNRFSFRLKNFEEGLYHFKHHPEYQYVFIENGDSIMMRLNTLDFDESLVFAGRGAEKNNFLIDMYLVNEDEEKLVNEYYFLEPGTYKEKMDSLRQMKLEQYENLVNNFTLSDGAKNISLAVINYQHYGNMEIYPYMHKKLKQLSKIEKLPADFYSYRPAVNYGDKMLSHFRPYMNFMVMHINNLSYNDCLTKCEKEVVTVEESLHYHTHKLELIDSLVPENSIKDILFRNTAYTFFFDNHEPELNEKFIERFNSYAKNHAYADEINQLYTNINQLQTGKLMPQVQLVNINGEEVQIKNTCKKNKTLYYFWSLNQRGHIKNITSRIAQLKEKYPNYHFVGINVNADHTAWVNFVKENRLDENYQFRSRSFEQLSKKFIVNNLNKVVIANTDGTIVNAFYSAYEPELETLLASN